MDTKKSLTGKVALITGAARNMGRAFAVALAARGANIVVHYHSDKSRADAEETARFIGKKGSKALLVQGDLGQNDTAERIFAEAISTFGHVDIALNNAGRIIKKTIDDYSADDFDRSFNINAKGAFLVMQQAARHLRDGGRVINMGTSLLGAFTGEYGLYAGSKAPLEHMTRALAKEVGARGITVNTVAPGPIDTAFFHGEENEQTVTYLTNASVANRLGRIEDIVPMVEFLASWESQWVTGQTLFVNGGFVTR